MQIFPISPDNPLREKTITYATTCSREVGHLLAQKMQDTTFTDWERVFVATDENAIIGYCTFTAEDGIPDVNYTPYIGFIFVDEHYRGQRLSEKMIKVVMEYAQTLDFHEIFIVSDHINFYEKYGFMLHKNRNFRIWQNRNFRV